MVELTLTHLGQIISGAVEIGYKKALSDVGEVKPFLNKSEAKRIYGTQNVNQWLKAGLIKPQKDGFGANYRFSRSELDAVAYKSNVATYLQTPDR